MISIFVGILLIAGGLSGHLNILGSNIGIVVFGGITIALGVRKMIVKAKRKKREGFWDRSY